MSASPLPAWPFFQGLENAAVPAGEPPVLRDLRAAARDRARALPLPDPRAEEWRHSDPRAFGGRALTPAPEARGGASATAPEPGDAEFDAVLAIRDGACSLAESNGALRDAGIEIRPLAEAASDDPAGVRALLGMELSHAPETVFEAWSAALWTWGLHLRVPAKARLERGVLLRFDWTGEARWHAPLIVVEAGEHSRFTLAERHTAGAGGGLVSVQRRLRAAEGAQTAWSHLQLLPDAWAWTARDIASAGRDARVDWLAAQFGASAVRTQTGALCAGAGAHAEVGGLFLGAGRRRLDQHTVQIHAAPDTSSALLYKGAVQDEARSVYRGVIAAQRGAVRIDAYQKNANLVLNDGARAEALPGLLIDADDLKCTHGATLGSLDPDQIYYLRCRGLSEHDARRLLLDGYFEELIGRWPAESLRAAARAALAAQAR